MTTRRDFESANRRDKAKASREQRPEWKPPTRPIDPKNPPHVYRTLKLKWPARCEMCHDLIPGGSIAREIDKVDGRRGYLHERHGI